MIRIKKKSTAEAQEIGKILATPLDLKKYPDVYSYQTVLGRALWALEVVEKEFRLNRLTSAQIARVLTEKFRIKTSPQAVNYALREAGNMVDRLMEKGVNYWRIMDAGKRHVYAAQIPESLKSSILIEPGKPFTGKRIMVGNVMAHLKGEIRICDPYCGVRTLDILNEISGKNKILLLTQTLENKKRFLREFTDFKKEHPNIEIRIYKAREIHDRYILTKELAWLVGHSLKDLGKKETVITKLRKDVGNALQKAFNERWKISKPLSVP